MNGFDLDWVFSRAVLLFGLVVVVPIFLLTVVTGIVEMVRDIRARNNPSTIDREARASWKETSREERRASWRRLKTRSYWLEWCQLVLWLIGFLLAFNGYAHLAHRTRYAVLIAVPLLFLLRWGLSSESLPERLAVSLKDPWLWAKAGAGALGLIGAVSVMGPLVQVVLRFGLAGAIGVAVGYGAVILGLVYVALYVAIRWRIGKKHAKGP